MKYGSDDMEMRAALNAAAQICAAARTAPKARGVDVIRTLVLTDADKAALTAEMRRIGAETGAAFLLRRTRTGLHLRAVGESPATADSAGISVARYKYVATCVGSMIAGLGGLYYVMD